MNYREDWEKRLKDSMSADITDIEQPDISIVSAARKKVMTLKKDASRKADPFSILLTLFSMPAKIYHAVVSLVFLVSCFLSLHTHSLDTTSPVAFNEAYTYNEAVSTHTVLYSISTLVVRD